MSEVTNGPSQNGDKKRRFDGTFGPAFLAICFQTILAIIGGAYIAGQVASTSENTKATTERLTQIIDRSNQRTDGINDRLIRVETLLDGLNRAIATVSEKIDRKQHQ